MMHCLLSTVSKYHQAVALWKMSSSEKISQKFHNLQCSCQSLYPPWVLESLLDDSVGKKEHRKAFTAPPGNFLAK